MAFRNFYRCPDGQRHIVGVDIGPVIDFGDFLHEMAIPVVIRHVVVPGLTDGADELGKGGRLISAWDNAIAIAPMIFRDAAERVRQKA